jgi:AAA+ ATPase superfamily predicted ATPase
VTAEDTTFVSTIEQVDAILVELAELPRRSPDAEGKLFELADAVLDHLDISRSADDADPVEALVDSPAGGQARRFIAIVLLRLLAVQPEAIMKTGVEHKVCDLFDDAFARTLYEDRGLPKGLAEAPNYEKTRALCDLAPTLEEELKGLVASMTDLRRIDAFRADLMAKVRRRATEEILGPFIPQQLIRGDVDSALKACSAYVAASPETALDLHDRALAAVEGLIQGAGAERTLYAAIFHDLGIRLRELLEADFGEHPVNAPATIEVSLADKKYPLEVASVPVAVRIALANRGPGVARNVVLRLAADAVGFEEDERRYSSLSVGTREVVFAGKVVTMQSPAALAEVSWESGRGSLSTRLFELELLAQAKQIDWAQFEFANPYSLMPVATETELAGRSAPFRQLVAAALSETPKAVVIHGQKRVGKTSLLNALVSELERRDLPGIVSVSITGGDIASSDPMQFVPRFGKAVCDEIRADDRFADVGIPEFEDTLAPLKAFGRGCIKRDSSFRLILAVDEFDLLPVDLYRPGSPAEAFFASLRTLTLEPWLRLILVGSERMRTILAEQGSHLNNVDEIALDYFARDRDFEDFRQLVAAPTAGLLEFTEGAIARIYDWVAGHPYFAKYVCQKVFERAFASQDAHVTDADVQSGVSDALQDLEQVKFSHFWADGIVERDAEKSAIVENRRRRVLHALSEHLQPSGGEGAGGDLWAGVDDVIGTAVKVLGLEREDVSSELQKFCERGVFVSQNRRLRPRIPLFGHWLADHGRERLPLSFTDEDAVERYRARIDALRVTPEEVRLLVEDWPEFQGRLIAVDEVCNWLKQFGDEREQRLAYPLLQHLTFPSDEVVRRRLGNVHRGLDQDARERRGARGEVLVKIERGRSDIAKARRREWLVTYFGPTAGSGNRFARLYAQQNNILISQNVVPLARASEAVAVSEGLLGIVVADDFLGSGSQGVAYLEGLKADNADLLSLLEKRDLVLHYVVSLAFDRAMQLVERTITELDLPVRLHVAKALGEEHRVFSEDSIFYPDEDIRADAHRLLTSIGERLEPRQPLGFGETAAAVVFEDSCPNNTLPVFRKSSRGSFEWRSLFNR